MIGIEIVCNVRVFDGGTDSCFAGCFAVIWCCRNVDNGGGVSPLYTFHFITARLAFRLLFVTIL